jgi:hypothetical protein
VNRKPTEKTVLIITQNVNFACEHFHMFFLSLMKIAAATKRITPFLDNKITIQFQSPYKQKRKP